MQAAESAIPSDRLYLLISRGTRESNPIKREKSSAIDGRFAAQRAAGTQCRHMVSNIAVTITGNRAAASAYRLVLISKDGNHRSLPPGRYACELIKEDTGRWRFSRRTVLHDHDYTLDGIDR